MDSLVFVYNAIRGDRQLHFGESTSASTIPPAASNIGLLERPYFGGTMERIQILGQFMGINLKRGCHWYSGMTKWISDQLNGQWH